MQIYFGCSPESHFSSFLQEYSADPEYIKKITIIDACSFPETAARSTYQRVTFEDIFRAETLTCKIWEVFSASSSDVFSHSTMGWSTSRTSSIGGRSPTTNAAVTITTPQTWAAAASKAVHLPTPSDENVLNGPHASLEIQRNRLGQRIDPEPRACDHAVMERVRRLKLCNIHFLLNDCPRGSICTHRHDYSPTPEELNAIRLIMRSSPCIHGTACADAKCLYGHRCLAPAWKDAPRAYPRSSTKPCMYADTCRFSAELHKLDLKVVRMTKIT